MFVPFISEENICSAISNIACLMGALNLDFQKFIVQVLALSFVGVMQIPNFHVLEMDSYSIAVG